VFAAISCSAAPPSRACIPGNCRNGVLLPPAQTTWLLFAIGPDVTNFLAVVTLNQSALGSVCLHFDCNVVEAMQMDYFMRLGFSRQGYEIRGRNSNLNSSGEDRRVVVIRLMLTTSNRRLTSPSQVSSAGEFIGRCRITASIGFPDLGKKNVKNARLWFSRWDFTRRKSTMDLLMILVPFLVVRNFKFYFSIFLSCFCN
jgi:hypothetical protein